MIAVDTALLDRHLFGAALGSSPDTWATWLTVLRAAFASPLDRRDKTTFTKIAGSRKPPQQRGAGAVLRRRDAQREKQNGRGARGLSSLFRNPQARARGDRLCVGVKPHAGTSQNGFRYALGFLEASPIRARKIRDTTANEIRLDGNIVIATHPVSYKRPWTYPDRVCF